VEGECRTAEGYEAMHAIRKVRSAESLNADPIPQRQFIHTICGIAA